MIEGSHLTVEGLELVAVLRALHDDLVAADLIVVIAVHRLTVLEHHIVCDVDDVIDRTDPGAREADLHPLRGWCELDVLHHACGITRTEIRILDGHLEVIVDILCIARLLLCRHMEALAEGCGCLTGDTDHTVAVHTVRGDLILVDRVIETEQGRCILADRRSLREDIETGLRCLRVELTAGAELLDGAHHTVGLYATELAGMDLDAILRKRTAVMSAGDLATVEYDRHHIADLHVRRTGDDLNELGRTDIHLTDDELRRIRMRLDGLDLSGDDLIEVLI